MATSNDIYKISNPAMHRSVSDSGFSYPRNGILKSTSSGGGKVNTNPNYKSPTENGNSQSNGVKKQVRHSIVSMDSTFDASDLEVTLTPMKRCQKRLSVLLHTHVILIIVCTLAIADAVCVIGQLICDILIMREKLEHYEMLDEELTKELLIQIACLNDSIHTEWNLDAILAVIKGEDIHDTSGTGPLNCSISSVNSTVDFINKTVEDILAMGNSDGPLNRHRRAIEPRVPDHEVDHGILYDLTHAFHLGSMIILSMLLLETLLKVFAMGTKLKHHKLEVFDAIVVSISWSLDVAFWEGIWAHPGVQAATILIYMLPWRVVRIVNSFVLVIQEKDHVQLKIVKQRLRQSLKKSKETLDKASSYRHEVKALAGLCRKLGASDGEIHACSPSGRAGRRGSIHSVLERAASLTFISTMSSVGSLPSLFDMGDSSSDEETNNNRHKELEKTASQQPTLRSALSSTTLDSNSGVFTIENEEHTGVENPAFDNSSNSSGRGSRGSRAGSRSRVEKGEGRQEVERTNSNDSVPPEYHIAVSKMDSDTRL